MASNRSSIVKMHMEYGGIKSTCNQPSGQVNHVSQDQGRQASNSNLLALPGIFHLLLIQVLEWFILLRWKSLVALIEETNKLSK